MCILFIAVKQHKKYPLIIAANRDEFHKRATLSSMFWKDRPHVLAGKDAEAGGTWMGISKLGKIAALTNIRAPGKEVPNAITRGKLVLDWISNARDALTPSSYRDQLEEKRRFYNGYNLLFGSLNDLYVYNNFENSFVHLEKGVFGLSNANLDSPWPKIMKGRDALAACCKQPIDLDREMLFEILADNVKSKDHLLPDTGVPIEWERKLSSIFIESPEYGTRSSTLLTIDLNNECNWEERTFDKNGNCVNQSKYSFNVIE